MKKNLILVLVVLSSLTLTAQEKTSLSLSSMTLNEKTWMTNYGFPVKSYDFSNQKVNQLLSTGLELRKKGKTLTTISYILGGAGAVLLFANGTSGGSSTAIISSGAMVGGLTISLIGNSKKRKAAKRIQNAKYLFDSN